MTPNDIEVLLHCHVSPESHPRKDAPAVAQALKMLYANDLIMPDVKGGPGCFNTTERGQKHIQQLCELPWPTKRVLWVNNYGDTIGDDEWEPTPFVVPHADDCPVEVARRHNALEPGCVVQCTCEVMNG